jgi:3'(2'), 5'-bisphosphate nucleotidase
MKTDTFQREIQTAIDAVVEASKLCQSVQSGIALEALDKKDKSPVTVADFGSQALICRELGEVFPGDPVIAEEDSAAIRKSENSELLKRLVSEVKALRPKAEADEICAWIDRGGERKYSDRFWTLDPIDGTKGFLRKEQYAIALALIVEGDLTVAALCCPNLACEPGDPREKGICFFAVRGEGAFGMSLNGREKKPIRVSRVKDTRAIRFCESFEKDHSSHEHAAQVAERLGIEAAPVRIDSQAKYAVVSRGEGDAYLRLPSGEEYREKIWDHAGGALIAEEAGGRVTDIEGRPLVFTHGRKLEENRGVIVSNGLVHVPILEAIRALGIG